MLEESVLGFSKSGTHLFLSVSLEQPLKSSSVAVGVEVKQMSGGAKSWIQSFGVIDGGLELMKYAWPSLDHKFSVRRNDTKLVGDNSKTVVVLGHHRYPTDLTQSTCSRWNRDTSKVPLLSTAVRLGKIWSSEVPKIAGPESLLRRGLRVLRCGGKDPSVRHTLRCGRRWVLSPDVA
jgi:hypothetical protein